MRFGVLGTGTVGLAISNRLAGLGHEVMVGTRQPSKSADKLKSKNEAVTVGTFAESAAFGEVIFNATKGGASLEALRLAGESNLGGKVLVDISNPLSLSEGAPPGLLVCNTDSLAEQIQRLLPKARVVKTLNTVTANVMVYPQRLAHGEHQVFVSGNDAQAKAMVTEILKSFGWVHILDLGDITTARGTEMYLTLWLRIWPVLGTGMFNIKIAR